MAAMPDIRRLDSAAPDFAAAIGRLTAVGTPRDEAIDTAVAAIIADVRVRGDPAVLEYTALLDRIRVTSVAALEIQAAAFEAAFVALPVEQRDALALAAQRIRTYH